MSEHWIREFRKQLQAFKKRYPQATSETLKKAFQETIEEECGRGAFTSFGKFHLEEALSLIQTAFLEDILSDIPFRIHAIAVSSTIALAELEKGMPDQLAKFAPLHISWPVLLSPAQSHANAAIKSLSRLGVAQAPFLSFDTSTFGRAPRESKSLTRNATEGLANKWAVHSVQAISFLCLIDFMRQDSKSASREFPEASFLPLFQRISEIFPRIHNIADTPRLKRFIKACNKLPTLTKKNHEEWFPFVWEWILIETSDKPEENLELLAIGTSQAKNKSIGLEHVPHDDALPASALRKKSVRSNVVSGIKGKLKAALKRIALRPKK